MTTAPPSCFRLIEKKWVESFRLIEKKWVERRLNKLKKEVRGHLSHDGIFEMNIPPEDMIEAIDEVIKDLRRT